VILAALRRASGGPAIISSMSRHEAELERIRTAYQVRDSPAGQQVGTAAASPWSDAGYRFYMQRLEWDLLDALGRAGAPLAGAKALEVGCGSGYFLNRLMDYGAAHGAGIDLMEERVAQGRERYPRLELTAGDASQLPWEDGSFDLVTHFTCLSSILDPALRADIAAEMWRVTRPGGAILSYDMRPTPGVLRAAGRALARGSGPGADATPIVQLGTQEISGLFRGAPAALETVTLNPALWPLARRSTALGVALRALPPLRSHLLAVFVKAT
jgi:SAM-dependent methyltransferase